MDFRVLLLTIIMINQIHSAQWDYGRYGPEVWGKTFKDCNGHSQSPVNIQTACTIEHKCEPFIFSPIHNEKLDFTLYNDGHTIMTRYNGPKLTLTGGNLVGNYQFISFHLHWGPNENVGSEHQINGVKYTGESHFVYKNIQTDDLAVLGFFMKSHQPYSTHVERENHAEQPSASIHEWKRYFNATQNLIKENDSTIVNLTLSLLMGKNFTHFWRYNGSLTIPPCTENVIWTLFREPIYIYDYKFESFRDQLFFQSYRGPQPLYNRQIYRSFPLETLSTIPDQNCCPNQGVVKNQISH